ncbi:MAG: hypothetical protein ABW034_01790 [Steroidobacteraceae bacterium]
MARNKAESERLDQDEVMEFRYSIQNPERFLRLHCRGSVTASGLIQMMQHIAADPQCSVALPVLADLREATGEWDYSETQSFRDYLVRTGRGRQVVRWGAIMSPGTLVAACHIVILITEPQACGIHMRLFEDPAVAEAWVLAERSAGKESVVVQA